MAALGALHSQEFSKSSEVFCLTGSAVLVYFNISIKTLHFKGHFGWIYSTDADGLHRD